jgi:signal transduction histidine kinase
MKMLKNKTILAVDDTASNLDILVDFLEEYEVIDTVNGYEALEILEEEKIDLILLDIVMPEIDGFTVCEKLKNNPKTKDIPVIFITKKADEESLERAYEVGGVDYVTKPFRKKELLSRIHTHILLSEQKFLLQDLVNKQVEQIRHQDKILQQQSKLAAMGEIMDAVAHQWKQPLNVISINTDFLEVYSEDGETIALDKVLECVENTSNQIEHLVNTIDEFRKFLRPNKNLISINLKNMVDGVVQLVHDDFLKHQIEIKSDIKDDITIKCIENEFKHVILNIINNAKDAIIENTPQSREIHITLEKSDKYNLIKIKDSAGGIPQNIIGHIFEANFTTKAEGKGTGIGLYMSAQILKKIGADISVENINNGSCFTIFVRL